MGFEEFLGIPNPSKRGKKKKQHNIFGFDPNDPLGLGKAPKNAAERDGKRTFGTTLQKTTYDKQNGKCKKCKRQLKVSHMEFHHKKSWSKGGKTISKNCVGICHECHKDIHDAERIREGDKGRRKPQKPQQPDLFGLSEFKPPKGGFF